MPSPREQNKRLIRQSLEANDKMMNIALELASILHTSDKPLPELYKELLEGNKDVDFGRYANVVIPLLSAYYYGELANEALTIARQQI